MHLKALRTAAVAGLLFPLLAAATTPVDIEILDRKTGQVLPVYWHGGERHVAGEPGREYEIRLRNQGGCRVLAVTSVDGVNVITGRTASTLSSGYVLDPWNTVDIDGWRKSMDQVAAFYFTALPDSYAARTGRPENVGVIGVALFGERIQAMPVDQEPRTRAEAQASAPATGAAAEADSPNAKSAARQSGMVREDTRLGTGHGRRVDSGAVYTAFERASDEPDEVIRIYYDSRKNLVARGIIPAPDRYARRFPDPFPQAFVPDP
jgi:pyruvate/2-oxoglutarate dehydrogenase complex dihydrolipoamide acyltransferase (E2) component